MFSCANVGRFRPRAIAHARVLLDYEKADAALADFNRRCQATEPAPMMSTSVSCTRALHPPNLDLHEKAPMRGIRKRIEIPCMPHLKKSDYGRV